MRRRTFLGIMSGVAAWPIEARAQQPAMQLVGFLSSRAGDADPQLVAAFRRGLREMGFVEDENVRIEFRWAAGRDEALPELAVGLVRQQASVLVAASGVASA